MSLPTHSKWKCLPEIHASRISVSGSLRPKLGLLMLSVVLLVSLVFILVPVITKLQQADPPSYPVLPLPLASILTKVSLGSNTPVILSPTSVLASLSTLNATQKSECQKVPGTTNVNISSIVIVKKGFKVSRDCADELVKLVEADNISEAVRKHMSNTFEDSSVIINSSHVSTGQDAVVLVTSSVKVMLAGHQVDADHVIMTGPVQVRDTPQYTIIRLGDIERDYELYLLQPHGDPHQHLPLLTLNMLDMSEIGNSHSLQLVLPSSVLRSSLSLGPELSAAGHNHLNVPVYHQSSLLFTPQPPQEETSAQTSSDKSQVKRMVMQNFYFVLKRLNSVILIGKIPK